MEEQKGAGSEEMALPFIGVVNSWNEVIPGHIHLDKLAEAVKAGIRMAGGVPSEPDPLNSQVRPFFLPPAELFFILL